MKRLILFAVAFAILATSASAQWLGGPVPADPWKTLGYNTAWVTLNAYNVPSFEILGKKSEKNPNRRPVKGDCIRLLVDLDLFVSGYWKNGQPKHGDPLISPAKTPFFADAGSHSKLGKGTKVLVEETVIVKDSYNDTPPFWARVSPVRD